MRQAKKQFVEGYINRLVYAIEAYNNSEAELLEQSENDLFDIVIEVQKVFSQELPNIDDAIFLRRGFGIRDANSVIGILRLYLLSKEETSSENTNPVITENKNPPKIFISHRSTDKKVADIIENFLTSCGIPYNNIFCSSLPGIY